ncbi:MAG TPA: DUF4157 domain-containing protein, partial [Acidimicrobiales bacterium]|nr:DUF4157 domain-containing protein [Acidimicrobiales bacterium]
MAPTRGFLDSIAGRRPLTVAQRAGQETSEAPAGVVDGLATVATGPAAHPGALALPGTGRDRSRRRPEPSGPPESSMPVLPAGDVDQQIPAVVRVAPVVAPVLGAPPPSYRAPSAGTAELPPPLSGRVDLRMAMPAPPPAEWTPAQPATPATPASTPPGSDSAESGLDPVSGTRQRVSELPRPPVAQPLTLATPPAGPGVTRAATPGERRLSVGQARRAGLGPPLTSQRAADTDDTRPAQETDEQDAGAPGSTAMPGAVVRTGAEGVEPRDDDDGGSDSPATGGPNRSDDTGRDGPVPAHVRARTRTEPPVESGRDGPSAIAQPARSTPPDTSVTARAAAGPPPPRPVAPPGRDVSARGWAQRRAPVARPAGEPVPADLRDAMRAVHGIDVGDVAIRRDVRATQEASALGAAAFARRDEVV